MIVGLFFKLEIMSQRNRQTDGRTDSQDHLLSRSTADAQ